MYFRGRPEPTNEKLVIKFGDSFVAHVLCNVELLPYRPYFNMNIIKFPKAQLGEDEKAFLRVCNELPDPLYISWNEEYSGKCPPLSKNIFSVNEKSFQKNIKK